MDHCFIKFALWQPIYTCNQEFVAHMFLSSTCNQSICGPGSFLAIINHKAQDDWRLLLRKPRSPTVLYRFFYSSYTYEIFIMRVAKCAGIPIPKFCHQVIMSSHRLSNREALHASRGHSLNKMLKKRNFRTSSISMNERAFHGFCVCGVAGASRTMCEWEV